MQIGRDVLETNSGAVLLSVTAAGSTMVDRYTEVNR